MRSAIHGLFLVSLMLGCDYDDPDDPGAENQVDFIQFSGPGRFRLLFVDVVFQSGEFAMDVIADQQPRIWRLGPGTDLIEGTDDDLAPYPNPTNSRKRTAHDGEWDRRYWVQFAGGAWSSLNIAADERAKFRASSSPPSIIPMTFFMWCPEGLACMTWTQAVQRRAARCFQYTLNGFERAVVNGCGFYHPRIHWHVVECDDCPIPAVTGGE